MDNIEVYKQAKGFATELQVRKYLGLMDKRDGIHGLEFYDYEIFNHKIHSVSEFELHSTIDDGKTNLGRRPESSVVEFVLQAGSVSALQ